MNGFSPSRWIKLGVLAVGITVVASCAEQNDPSPRWQLINYWAVWCKPCIEEIPELNELARKHGDLVRVTGVNFDGMTGEELAAEAEKLGVEFELLETDPASALGYNRPRALPTTVLINPAGEITHILEGPQTSDSLYQAMNPGEQ